MINMEGRAALRALDMLEVYDGRYARELVSREKRFSIRYLFLMEYEKYSALRAAYIK